MDDSCIYWAFAALMFASGACVGSFINAAAMRTVLEKKWWGAERSVCDTCGEPLGAIDLVPIFSFILLRGKCRHCGARIPIRHFAAELVAGAITSCLFARWGLSMALAMSLIVLSFSLFNSMTDLENGFIYDVWALAPGAIGLVLRLTESLAAAGDGLLGALLGGGLITAIIILSRGGMGWGDAMLMAGLGGCLGWRYTAVTLYAGFMLGGIVILPLIALKKVSRKDAIPLGPFLAAGGIAALFFGDAALSRIGWLIDTTPVWPWM